MSCIDCGCKSCRCCPICKNAVCSCPPRRWVTKESRTLKEYKSPKKKAKKTGNVGWQCPICKTVMAPHLETCVKCK